MNQLFRELEESYQKIELKVHAFLAEAEECTAETKVLQAQVRAYISERNAGLFNHPPEIIEEQSNTGLNFLI